MTHLCDIMVRAPHVEGIPDESYLPWWVTLPTIGIIIFFPRIVLALHR